MRASQSPVHTYQLLTYLKITGKRVGVLLNFNAPTLRQGIKRVVLTKPSASSPPAAL